VSNPNQPPPGYGPPPPYGPPPTVNVYQKKGGGCGTVAIVLIILAVFAVVGFVIMVLIGVQLN
jgi:hypothetical protein